MEDILASIKRIIAEDSAAAVAASRSKRGPRADTPKPQPKAAEPDDAPSEQPQEEVLELTEPVEPVLPTQPLVSDDAAIASRRSLEVLSSLIVTPENGSSTTLESLVRELLRPMLKEWLDARLPDIVEGLVAREIARITGKTL